MLESSIWWVTGISSLLIRSLCGSAGYDGRFVEVQHLINIIYFPANLLKDSVSFRGLAGQPTSDHHIVRTNHGYEGGLTYFESQR